MKVLSLFDGMACGMIAMQAAGVDVESYDAYEIDKYAIRAATHNFPMIQEHGDVFTADFTQYAGVDFLVGGSPCTHWSIAQTRNRETSVSRDEKGQIMLHSSGIGFELFSQYLRALEEAKPRYFIYENNWSMSEDIRAAITECFGFEPIMINSALVSAQNRKRLYWVGKRTEDGTYSKVNVEQPEDRGILLKDVLDSAVAFREKAYTIDANYYKTDGVYDPKKQHSYSRLQAAVPVNATAAEPIKELSEKEMDYMVRVPERFGYGYIQKSTEEKAKCITANISKGVPYNVLCEQVAEPVGTVINVNPSGRGMNGTAITTDRKSRCLTTNKGEGQKIIVTVRADGKETPFYEVRDGQITIKGKQYPIKLRDGFYSIRKLTVSECKRLQTVPERYDFSCVSNGQAYKMLGNGWTCEVITHLIRACLMSADAVEDWML